MVMRLYINELFKALCRRSTVGIMIALMLLNGVLLWVNESGRTDRLYSSEEYRDAYESIEKLDAAQAYMHLTEKQRELRAIESLSVGEDISYLYDEDEADELLEKYSSNTYLEYCTSLFAEQQLVREVLKEVEACAEYDSYLESIDEQAAKMTGFSLFADPESFSYKNIVKTPSDFAHLKGSTLTPAPCRGVDMATDFLPTDIAAFLMIMTVVVTLVTKEKEHEQTVLTRTTCSGRAPYGAAKLFTCFSAAFTVLVLLWSVNFTAGCLTYGFGDLSRQLQSVYSFNGSELKISIVQYFGLFLLSKLGVYCLFAALIYLIASLADSAVKVYASLAVILAAEAVMYYTIPSTSWLCPLKYINLAAFADTHDIFARYLNLNIFGEPIGYKAVFVVSVCVLLMILSILGVICFAGQRVIKNRTKRLSVNIFKGRSTSLLRHEAYKVFIGGKVLVILLALGAFVWLGYKPMNESFASADEIYYKQYMLKIEGKLAPEKVQFLDDEQARFQQAQTEMMNAMSQGSIFTAMKYQQVLAPQQAFERVREHAEYLRTVGGEFVYDSGYKLLTGDSSAGNKDELRMLTALAMLICTLTCVYSVEYQTGAHVLLHTAPRGRREVFWRKFLIGVIVHTIVFALTYAPYFYNVLHAYGTRGISAAACSMEHLSGIRLSILAYIIVVLTVRYLLLTAAVLLIYFISSKARSFISALLIETAMLIMPIVMYLLLQDI